MNRNFSMVFEENFLRFIGEIDKVLLYLRNNINESNGNPNFGKIVHSTDLRSEIIVQVAVIDAKGILRASNVGEQPTPPIDLSYREHYRMQVDAVDDKLFIGKPLVGRSSGAWSIQFSRRFLNPDQSFGGVVVASLKPEHLMGFYDEVHFQSPTSISIIGDDGIVRASGGTATGFSLGADIRKTPLFEHVRTGKDAAFEDSSYQDSSRLTTLHRIRGTKFWVAISTDKAAIHTNTLNDLQQDMLAATLLTLLVLAAVYRILKSEGNARRKAKQLKLTLENMTQGIMLVTPDHSVPIINKKCGEIFELPDALTENVPQLSQVAEHLTQAGKGDLVSELREKVGMGAQTSQGDAPNISISEHIMPNQSVIEQRVVQLLDHGLICTFTDITDRWNAEAQAARLACEDQLTELLNRRGFYKALAEPMANDQPLALLFFDLDRFKVINDSLGHRIGDLLLREVAKRLTAGAREQDILTRLGGDEFALIVRDFKDRNELEHLAKSLINSVAQPYNIEGQTVCTSASAGIALRSEVNETADELLIAADLALYAVKIESRGGCKFYHPSMNQELTERRKLEMDLRSAIAANELRVHFQPVMGLKSGVVEGFEALARWHHPTRGMVPPIDFITVAEDSHLILPLTQLVMMEACTQAKKWPESVHIAVNLSPVSFNDANLLDNIKHVLHETGLSPHRLELEITEQTCMSESEHTLVTLKALKQLGVQIVLDDFGTGYSSLSYLRKFPFDKIKVDRGFVSGLERGDHEQITIVQAVIMIARAFGMSVTAEGVETEEQREFLASLGCDLVQGYLFSPAMIAERVPDFLKKWKFVEMLAA